MMFLKASLLIFMVCVGCVYAKQSQLQTNHVTKKANQPTSAHISCIKTYVSHHLNDNAKECLDVTTKLMSLYSSSDILSSISFGLSSFPTFCNPSCGRVIENAWRVCNLYNDAEQVAKLLTGLCASNKGTTCYSNYNQLIAYYNSGISCYNRYISSNTCTSSCSTTLRDGAVRYGCCVNLPISYKNYDDKTNSLFSACGVTRPSNCKNSPLAWSGNVPAATKLGNAVFIILVIIHLIIF